MSEDPLSTGADGQNPLLDASPEAWTELITATGPAAMLVVISKRMSAAMIEHQSPEDVWQDALLHAWRDRALCQWRGPVAFRKWLLAIVENRLRDLADRQGRQKRGGGRRTVPLHPSPQGTSMPPLYAGPVASTTPSRVAMDRETACVMNEALETLPGDLRDVVWLRLFEDLTLEEVSARLDVGVSAVRHRFRNGCEIYHREFSRRLGSRSATFGESE